MMRARHAVVLKAARDELAIVIVDNSFHQRLADSLRKSAVDLAFRQEGIEHSADIVDRDITVEGDEPGLRINFDLADMAPIWISRRLAGPGSRRLQTDVELLWQKDWSMKRLSDVGQRN